MNSNVHDYEADAAEREGNRRQYPRIPFQTKLQYVCALNNTVKRQPGTFHNISQSGALFETEDVPPLSAVIFFETDLDDLAKCLDIDMFVLSQKQRLIGKVIRVVRQRETDMFHIGLQFITSGQEVREDVRQAVASLETIVSVES